MELFFSKNAGQLHNFTKKRTPFLVLCEFYGIF